MPLEAKGLATRQRVEATCRKQQRAASCLLLRHVGSCWCEWTFTDYDNSASVRAFCLSALNVLQWLILIISYLINTACRRLLTVVLQYAVPVYESCNNSERLLVLNAKCGLFLRIFFTCSACLSVCWCERVSQPIEVLFGEQLCVSPRNHVLDGVHMGATWRIRLIDPCCAVRRCRHHQRSNVLIY